MTDFKSELRNVLEKLYLTGHDIGDAGYPEPHKTDESYISKAESDIIALFISKLPKKDMYEIRKSYTHGSMLDHKQECYSEGWKEGRNDCLADIKGEIE